MTLKGPISASHDGRPPSPTNVVIDNDPNTPADNGGIPNIRISWTAPTISVKTNWTAPKYNYTATWPGSSQSMVNSAVWTSPQTIGVNAAGQSVYVDLTVFDALGQASNSARSNTITALTRPANVGTVTFTGGTNTCSATWSAVNAGGASSVTYRAEIWNSGTNTLYASGDTVSTSFSLSNVPAGTYYAKVYAYNTLASQKAAASQSSTASVVAPPFFPFFPSFGPFFPFFPSFGPYFPYFACVQGDTLVKTMSGYVKARDLYVGQKIASYSIDQIPMAINEEPQYDFETWTSTELTNANQVETTIKAIKSRNVSTTVMLNNDKGKRFSLEHIILIKRDGTYMFVQAGVIRQGDYLVYDIENSMQDILVDTVGYLDEETDVYEIRLDPYDLFIAGDLVVHNKKSFFQGPTKRDLV